MQTLTSLALVLALGLAGTPVTANAPDEPLAWLAGQWCGGNDAERLEEHWLAPVAGSMLGVARTMKNGRVSSFEFLRIGQVQGVSTYLAQPGGRPATAFARTAGGAGWIRFENPSHDFPTRIEYRRQGDALHASVSGKGNDGKETGFVLDFVRCGASVGTRD